jgi:hypothetical protein
MCLSVLASLFRLLIVHVVHALLTGLARLIADAKGRLLCLLLSGGEAHDCPPLGSGTV